MPERWRLPRGRRRRPLGAAAVAAIIALSGAFSSSGGSSPHAAPRCRPAILCLAGLQTLPTLAASTATGAIDSYVPVTARGAALVRLDGRVVWKVATRGATERPRLVAAGDFTGD